ncbi:MAG: hypothetical protein NUV77_25450 [Thermoguttaceae bacterium]|nr:hypothetical protein [Thermoguttaceae bacterium]
MRRSPMPRPAAVFLLLVVALGATCGCGNRGPETVPVRGRVTFGGGPWPKPGTINFLPHKPHPDYPSRPGSAEFDTEGNFVVTSWRPGDGLAPGTYRVSIDCWEVPETMDKPNAGRNCVPPKYRNSQTSGLEVTVEEGKPISDLRFDVPKP